MLSAPSLDSLAPRTVPLADGRDLQLFVSEASSLVKLDLTFEAGSRYQWLKSQAHAASQLVGEATALHEEAWVAEFLDFRGITLERSADVCTATLSFYFLRRYAAELLPVLREMVARPRITPSLFDAYVRRRRHQLLTSAQKTSAVARNHFYSHLYGPDHPLGTYATAEDLDALHLDDVVAFVARHYRLAEASIVLSGSVDDELVALVDSSLASPEPSRPVAMPALPPSGLAEAAAAPGRWHVAVPSAVQATIRVGRVLPYTWDDPAYARFMVLNTVLGGYFGSRLMSNLREEKGYTYGIYSQTQIFRGQIVFFITADVSAEAAEAACGEILSEMHRLSKEPVGEAELERVCNFMMGDFIRSIDGVLEIAERYRHMRATAVGDRFTERYLATLGEVTPEQLIPLAQNIFAPADLTIVTASR